MMLPLTLDDVAILTLAALAVTLALCHIGCALVALGRKQD